MKQIHIFILIFLLVGSGCNKELELAPPDKLPNEEALSDIKGIQAAVSGMYAGMRSASYYGRSYLVIPELAADNVYISSSNSNRYLSAYRLQWLTSDADLTGVWNQAYAVILRANNIINSIDKIPDGTEEEKNEAVGQALFIRALCHFDLCRLFAEPYVIGGGSQLGVPYVKTFEIGSPKRNTVEEVYTQIIADLVQAKAYLKTDKSSPYNANAYAASALLARVYLYKNDNVNAAIEATNVIDAGYSIQDADELADFYNTPGTEEEIFTLRFLATETAGSNNLGNMYLKPGYGDIRVSPDIVNIFDPADARRTSFIGPFTGSPSEFQNIKFSGQDGIAGLYSTKILRISEIYLIRAEANTKQSKYDEAIEDVNVIRQHRNLEDLQNIPNNQVLAEVLEERRKEFMFEGHRYFDLLRNKQNIVRDYCGNPNQLNVPNCTIEATSLTAIPPIPQREIDVNTNMEQNEGYKK